MFATTALASAIATVVAAGPVSTWPILTAADNSFSVRMPGLVSQSVEEVQTDVALLVRRDYTCTTSQTLWQVTRVDLTREMLLGKPSSEILAMSMNSSRRNKADSIVLEKQGFRDGAPFRVFRVVPRVGLVVSKMVVLDGNRLYHLQVVSRPDKFRQVGTRSFFESFTLLR